MAKDEVVVVSGCTSGFGRHLALEGLKAGLRIIATARKVEDIRDLEEAGATILELDVTSPADVIEDFAKRAIAVHGHVDYLINNAGTGGVKTVEESSPEFFQWVFDTNYFGHVRMSKAFLPHMRVRRSGTIVQISSRNADIGMFALSAYASSKAALSVFSDTLRKEAKTVGVRAMSVQPGPFRTAMLPKAKGAGSELYPEVDAIIKRYVPTAGKEPGDPAKGARRIIEVMTMEGELPERLALGQAAYDGITTKLQERLKEMEQWRDSSLGVECDD